MDIRHLLRSASLSPSFSVITTSSMKVLLNTCTIRLTTSGSAAVLPCARAVRPSSCVDSDQHRVVGNSRALAPKQGSGAHKMGTSTGYVQALETSKWP
jgi:hypothetical protein